VIAKKPAVRFMIRERMRVVKLHPKVTGEVLNLRGTSCLMVI
jgi:hypothetical protein